jgi:hypothetical protein
MKVNKAIGLLGLLARCFPGQRADGHSTGNARIERETRRVRAGAPAAPQAPAATSACARANANVPDAARDLLDALEKEQEWQDRARAGELDPDWDYETMVGQYRRAAIAKATQPREAQS